MSNSPTGAGEAIASEVEGGVARITLAREDVLNAFDSNQYIALRQALERAAESELVRCVLLGARGRAFSAGSDLKDDAPDPGAYDAFIHCLEEFPKPIVAAVNGLAVGIGATLLGHCDIVIASEKARFKLPFASIGLVPEAGSTVTMPAAMGPQATAHAMFTGEWLAAEAAERAGLVWRVVPAAALEDEARSTCAAIAAMPTESLVETKRLLLAARLPAARAAREREESVFARMLDGEAHREAVAAFKRRQEG